MEVNQPSLIIAAAIDLSGNLIQFHLPTVSSGGTENNDISMRSTLLNAYVTHVATTNDQVFALNDRSNTIYALSKDHASPTQISRWFSSSVPTVKLEVSLGWGERIVQICSGFDFLLVLSNRGRVFGMPCSESAKELTGRDSKKDVLSVLKGLENLKIAEIAAGSHHALFRSTDGRVFGVGSNRMGVRDLRFHLNHTYSNLDQKK